MWIKKSSFLSKFSILLSGSAIAQLIPIVTAPLLTRLYTPEQFGHLGVFTAVFAIVSTIVTARYELGIVSPRTNVVAIQIVYLSCLVALLVAITSFLLTAGYSLLNIHNVGIYWILPPLLFFWGVFQAFNYWHNRNNNFHVLAKNKLVQNAGMVLWQTIFFSFGEYGLVVGFCMGTVFSAIYSFWKAQTGKKYYPDKKKILVLARQYKSLPKYNFFPAMLDALTYQIPILAISWYYSRELTGYYFLATKILIVPIGFLITIMAQVYLNEISLLYKNSRWQITQYIKNKAKICCYLALPPCIMFFFFGKPIVTFIFGQSWHLSGELASVIIFSATIRFIVAPLSSFFIATKQMKIASLWQITYFLSIAIVTYIFLGSDLKRLIIAYTISDIVIYCFYYFLIIHKSSKFKKSN